MSWLTLLVFAISYSIPLGGILIRAGFGFNKIGDKLTKNKDILSRASGFVLVVLGFGMVLRWI